MNVSKKNEYCKEIHVARGIGVLLVLFGHSFPDAELNWFPGTMSQWGHDFVYSFHMALFFMISGFVVGKKYFAGTFGLRDEIVRKFKRLMIPYLFLAYISLMPKILLNRYAMNPVDSYSALKVLLGKSPNGSLWYLYTLFVYSCVLLIMGCVLRTATIKTKKICMIIGAAVFLCIDLIAGEELILLSPLDRIVRYFPYYVLGVFIRDGYDSCMGIFRPVIGMAALTAAGVLSFPLKSWSCPYFLTALPGIYGILAVSIYFKKKEGKLRTFFEICADNSYAIYIMSYYVQQFVRIIVYHYMGAGYTTAFCLELLLGFAIPLLFSISILPKSRLLKILLIGEWEESHMKGQI